MKKKYSDLYNSLEDVLYHLDYCATLNYIPHKQYIACRSKLITALYKVFSA